jgi:hypothetical protein
MSRKPLGEEKSSHAPCKAQSGSMYSRGRRYHKEMGCSSNDDGCRALSLGRAVCAIATIL